MQINDNYKIEADELNVVLIRRRVGQEGKSMGVEIWEPVAYHTSLKNALKDFARREVHSTELTSLTIIVQKMDEIEKAIDKLEISDSNEI